LQTEGEIKKEYKIEKLDVGKLTLLLASYKTLPT